MTWTICGIDPGLQGGVCLMDHIGILLLEKMPDISALREWVSLHKPTHVYLEKAQPMPKQGVSSVYTYGHHCGVIEGLLIALKVPYTLVPPKTWQKPMFIGTATDIPPKKRALVAARRLFPKEHFVPNGCRVPHDGLVDAALIALWGVRKTIGTVE